mgnify:FL=1
MGRLEQTIGAVLKKHPNERCLWWEGRWWTSDDFLAFVETATETLRAGGFREGQRIAVLLPNSPLVLALSLAAWNLGGAIAPLNAKAGTISLTRTIDLIEPCAVVLAQGLDELQSALEEKGIPTAVPTSLSEVFPKISTRPTASEDRSMAVIFATSGTTGLPKAVPLSHGNLLDNVDRMFEALTLLQEGDRLLNVLPNFHSFGYTVSGMLPLVKNMKQVILASFLPPMEAMRTIHDGEVNVIIAVPAMVYFMTVAAQKGAPKPVDLKMIVVGGDRYNVQLEEKVMATFGAGVIEGYGLTECSPVVAVNRNFEMRRLGTVGPILEGYDWKLMSRDGEEDHTKEGEGVLWVKGPSVTSGYFRDPEKTAERFKDGWFDTGDYVRMEDGCVHILDRVTDIIIVGGFNVYPQEVEAILNAHPAVQQAAVIGIPHPVNGEVPKAFVQLKEGQQITSQELIKFCKQSLAHFKVPRTMEFVGELPLSPTGKILRRVLRERK